MSNNKINKHSRLFLTVGLVLGILLTAEFSGLRQQFNIETIQTIFQEHFMLATSLYFLVFILGNLLQIPGWIFLGAAVLSMGQIHGYFLTLMSALASCAVSFYTIRFIGQDSIRKINSKWVQKTLSKIDQRPIASNIILRLGLQTSPVLNYTLAMSGISFRDYFLGALLGLPLPILLYTLFINEIIRIYL